MKQLTFSNEESEFLSKLAAPWVAAEMSEQIARIRLDDDMIITITSEGVDVDRFFECFRLTVSMDGGALTGQPPRAFRVGAQTIQILQSEEWLAQEQRPASGLIGDYVSSHYSGVPGSAPVNAKHRCLVYIGVLLIAPTGERLLIRCATTPCWLRVIKDDNEIERDLQNYSLRDLTHT